MPKVLFELNFESVVHMESLTDYYSSLMNSTMLDFISSSSVNMTKEFLSYRLGVYSLSEFMDECTEDEKRHLIYKALLDTMFPIIYEDKVLYISDMNWFRPGYMAESDVVGFTRFFYASIKATMLKIQNFIKNQPGRNLPTDLRMDVRFLLRLNETTKFGIRDVEYHEYA